MKIFTNQFCFNADEFTPVGLYLQLRNRHINPCLLESNDYHDRNESSSIIGLDPLIELILNDSKLEIINRITFEKEVYDLKKGSPFELQISEILTQFQFENDLKSNGYFGRFGFEFALNTEIHISKNEKKCKLPEMHLFIFKYLIVLDHFKDEGKILKNSFDDEILSQSEIDSLLLQKPFTQLPFEITSEEESCFSEDEYKSLVKKAQDHCQRGDVFQLVLANQYSQKYFGDDFIVYRNLRNISPSPYLFYFDFEDYRLFGSSPEAQLKITNQKAEIHPIAGTILKTGDPTIDDLKVQNLKVDEKENAEHTMLVDLARNDLSKSCDEVKVEVYKEIQQFSHVFHIVSKVTGKLTSDQSFQTFNQTFPAGTLSGAPKPKALELISKYEHFSREFYGGAIGFFQPNGNLNMAIVIRSILSKNNSLYYNAGAGIVLDSNPQGEFDEIQNKLRAVRLSIEKSSKQTSKKHTYENCSN